MKSNGILIVSLCVFTGILMGIGLYTFHYAKGTSYLSNDPAACTNCHVMQEEYDSWLKSSHHKAATCNDCHIPHRLPEKFIMKALNGWNHSKAFTLQNFPEPIRISNHNLRVLEENCIDCHEVMASQILKYEDLRKGEMRCTECHRSVGHMSL